MDRDVEEIEMVENIKHHYIPIHCVRCMALLRWENPVLYLQDGKEIPLCDLVENREGAKCYMK